jgi:hypothetical protein
VLAAAYRDWLGIGPAGLARAENTSSSGSGLTSPDVSATVRTSCAPSAPVRLGRHKPRAEHGDLVHGAFAAGSRDGVQDGRGGVQRSLAQTRVLLLELGGAAGFARRGQRVVGAEKAGV